MNNNTVIGIDIAKNVFYMHSEDASGNLLVSKEIRRHKLIDTMAQYPQSDIVMEACGGAHYWSRTFKKLGHRVSLISPQHVKPFVLGNKTDKNDAAAIVRAFKMKVPTAPQKNIEQQDLQMLLRIREGHVRQRTALANQLRGFLAEFGITIAKGISYVRKTIPFILEDGENELTTLGRELLHRLFQLFKVVDTEIETLSRKVDNEVRRIEMCRKFTEAPGIGPISALTAYVALGEQNLFTKGRQFAAYLGLAPREHSSGGKQRLLGISKRGNTQLRTVLIHGGRTVINSAKRKLASEKTLNKLEQWVLNLAQSKGSNVAAVALANKNARHLWAMAALKEKYVPYYLEN